ncbi:uncharacterized protein si:dkey-10c21.1 isoform X1 [Sebastes umbrosus]|uniref:uncharacterized protein si:dkey-10c21.1 isoform X1 n=1 Tax=Sebastes umbrosus TaxID=72105 RepID=UPI00189D4E5A|nr:uncharacterized protein si:dkey-10c21.1 isoform X1 [Sebastes umbrosus]
MDQLKSEQDRLGTWFSGSPTPTLLADSNSVVIAREITNVTANSLSTKIETGSSLTGNAVGPVLQADYTAHRGSVICADKISGGTLGDIDLSVSVKTSQVCAGTVDEKLPSSQGSAVKMIIEHKVELIACLRADLSFILQHVHARHIVTDRQYQNLKHLSQPEETVINLIDQVIDKGQEYCLRFLDVLKDPDVLRTYPQLKDITKKWC